MVEQHADDLRKKAAVYINTDSNGRGFLSVGGSHTLEKFINEVGRDVVDPQTKRTVLERSRAEQIVNGPLSARKELISRRDLRISALGSGSDYTPFLQHIGIASLNIGFGGENGGGSYHSIYDSFDHYTRFGDPGFEYGLALAKVCGRATIRLASAETLPFEFTNFADTIETYINEIKSLTDSMREQTIAQNYVLSLGLWVAVQDQRDTYVVPKTKATVPYLNFAPLQNALSKLNASATTFQVHTRDKKLSTDQQKMLDEILYKTERVLTRNEGLPRRDWFRHQIYAPGFYTGYGVKTLPGVREAIEQREWQEAEEQIVIAAKVIDQFATEIDKATKLF